MKKAIFIMFIVMILLVGGCSKDTPDGDNETEGNETDDGAVDDTENDDGDSDIVETENEDDTEEQEEGTDLPSEEAELRPRCNVGL